MLQVKTGKLCMVSVQGIALLELKFQAADSNGEMPKLLHLHQINTHVQLPKSGCKWMK